MVLMSVLSCSIITSVVWDRLKPADDSDDEELPSEKLPKDLEIDSIKAEPQPA